LLQNRIREVIHINGNPRLIYHDGSRGNNTYVFTGLVKYILTNESEKTWKLSLPVLRTEENSETQRLFFRHELLKGDLKKLEELQITPGERVEFSCGLGKIQIGKRCESRHVLVFGPGEGDPDEFIVVVIWFEVKDFGRIVVVCRTVAA
jgi:hypothetical protein